MNINDINPKNTPYGIMSNYGFFHVYAFTMTMGILITALLIYIKLQKRRLPTEPLLIGILFVVPIALCGASFIGKIGTGIPIGARFEFWKAGMSIHGAILFGAVACGIYFAILSRFKHISAWAYLDAIAPNILIGQVIGRWGNFFNHELLGSVVSAQSLHWLPAFIWQNCWQWDPNNSNIPEMVNNHIVYRAPIFLYESFGNFCAWAIITFISPNLGKWIGPKPHNKKGKRIYYKSWSGIPFFWLKQKENRVYESYENAWCNVFENVQPAWTKTLKTPRSLFKKLYNPGKYWITMAGVESGLYIFFWNGVRMILEVQRTPDLLFIPDHRTLDYIVICACIGIGLLMAVSAQWLWPLFRRTGWIYEKPYLDLSNLSTWPRTYLAKHNLIYSQSNTNNTIKHYVQANAHQLLGLPLVDTNVLGRAIKPNTSVNQIPLQKCLQFSNFHLNAHHEDSSESLYFKYKIKVLAAGQKHFSFWPRNYEVITDLRFNFSDLFIHRQRANLKIWLRKNNFNLNSSPDDIMNELCAFLSSFSNQKRLQQLIQQKCQLPINWNATKLSRLDWKSLINQTKVKYHIRKGLVIYRHSYGRFWLPVCKFGYVKSLIFGPGSIKTNPFFVADSTTILRWA